MSDPIGVIVLAAGQGSRFRQVAGDDKDKLLVDCTARDGVTVHSVIEQVLVNLPAALEKRVLVTTADRPQVIRMAQAYGCEIVRIESTGLGDSIAAGVAACSQLGGWLIMLGDMPFILPQCCRPFRSTRSAQSRNHRPEPCESLAGDPPWSPVRASRARPADSPAPARSPNARSRRHARAVHQQLVLFVTRHLSKPTALPRGQYDNADGVAHTPSCNGFFCFSSTPFLIATISASSDKAISAGVWLPMCKPIGPCKRSMACCDKPS